MKSSYRIKIIVFGLLLAFLLPVFVQAAGSNNLIIIKILNEENHFINEKPEGSTAVAGAIYRIWRIGDVGVDTSQVAYDQLLRNLGTRSLEYLDINYPQPENKLSAPTDVEGKTTFENLPDGRYYVREVLETENGLITSQYSVPFVVDLPLLIDGNPNTNVTVYPKSTTPPTPPEEEKPPPTGGEKFIKVDSLGRNLEGVRFKVVDRVRDEQGNYIKDAGGNFVYKSVYLDGREILLVSDENGRFEVRGLPYGVYWLVETAAPLGYRLLTQPLEFAITKNSYDDSIIIQIVNQEEPPDRPPDRPPESPPTTPPSVPPDVPTKPPESPDTPTPVTPPGVPISPPGGPRPPITIPKTGDIEILLFIAAGVAMVILGAWVTKDIQTD